MSVQIKTIKTNGEEYLNEILKEIELKKLQRKHIIYRINNKLTDQVVGFVKTYFNDKKEYDVEFIKCKKAKNVWDLIILF